MNSNPNQSYISSFQTVHPNASQDVRLQPLVTEDPKPEYTVGNVKKYINAELSLQIYGPVTEDVAAMRRKTCMECPSRFSSAQLSDSVGFCKACGCGVSAKSRLSSKIKMPDSECPAKKWGKAKGRHKTFKDRLKSWLIHRIIN